MKLRTRADATELSTLPLDHTDGYLLSRLEVAMTFQDLCQVSAIDPTETWRRVERMLGLGLIEIIRSLPFGAECTTPELAHATLDRTTVPPFDSFSSAERLESSSSLNSGLDDLADSRTTERIIRPTKQKLEK